MIRINLIRVKKKKRKKIPADMLVLIFLIIFVIGLFSFHRTVLVSRANELRSEVARANREIARLKKQIGEVEKFKKKKEELQKKVDIVAKLQKGRQAPVVVLDALARAVPEKAWLTSLKYTGASLKLKGYALNNYVIADFMNNLGSSGRFGDIDLKSAVRKSVKGIELMEFEISCKTKG
ncbi:MAG: hypothetical protein D6713_04880 [Deltaproteobacteria bacterium]|nr:MAG: hypothetical protein D6713_04880 [Deltaproteobacteria bacterium]